MRFLADENIPVSAVSVLRSLGHDAKHLIETAYRGARDAVIFELAVQERRHLITKDLDFGNIFVYRPRKETGILVVRIRDDQPGKIGRLLAWFFNHFQGGLGSKLVILEEDKYRIRQFEATRPD